MKNRIVGILVIVIAAFIGFIIFSFNRAMVSIVETSCSHGPTCPMWGTIDFQTNFSIGIMLIVAVIGVYLTFFGEEEKIITKIRTFKQQIEPNKITKGNYKKILSMLSAEEKTIFGKIIDSQGSVLQSDLINQNINKVRVTRILDRLEGKGLVERKRRGMTNVVILKR
jgi:TM2 domain-containing membrane protein YozV